MRSARRVRVEAAAQGAEQVDHLATGEVGPEAHVTGHERETAVQRGRVAPGVQPQDRRLAGLLVQHAQEDAERRRLAGPVRPEEAVDLAGLNGEIELVERPRAAEAS